MIKIERLIKEDIPQVVLLEEQFLGETLGTEMFENEINNESICFLTAKDNQKVLGYIGAYVVAGDLEILNFVVDEQFQRTGIGTLLLNELLNKYPDAKTVVLEVREQNEKGINFYKKNNFNVISKRKHYYKNGDDALVMMKELI